MIEQIDKGDMLDIEEAARYKGCSTATIRGRVTAQKLPDRRGTHGVLLFTTAELDAITVEPPRYVRNGASSETPTADPDAIRVEVLLLSRMIGTLFHNVDGCKGVKQFSEVKPSIRVWECEVEVTGGTEKYQVIYDLNDFRVQRID